MASEQNSDYILRDKTGWTKKGGTDISWWVGYVERRDNVFFFATRITKHVSDSNPNFSKCRKEITVNVLKQLGILELSQQCRVERTKLLYTKHKRK